MVHIWHEDSERSSTTQFWKFLQYNNVSPKLRNAEIKGFSGNKLLLNHLKDCITTGNINPNDVYIIFADNVQDNDIVMRYYLQIESIASSYSNIHVQKLLSFEFLMLKFKYLTTWTDRNYVDKSYEEAKQLRNIIIDIVDNNKEWYRNEQLVKYVVKRKNINTSVNDWRNTLTTVSTENIVTWILGQITEHRFRETKINKVTLGNCWKCNCCGMHPGKRIDNQKCSLYSYRKTSQEKANNLWNCTVAKQIINNTVR